MSRRRFFVLDESCPASEIPRMMGRVVADKLLPLQKFAPFEPVSSNLPPHRPEDIIPDILPPPSVSTNRKEILSVANDHRLQVALSILFGMNFAQTKQEKVELESKEVKQYTLSNPDEYFDRLMENDLYAADVQKLLLKAKKGRAYLVTGFLTTSGAVWTRTKAQSRSAEFSVTVPVSEIAGLPLPGLLDPTIAPSCTTSLEQHRQMQVNSEEIFAVSYSLVKVKYSFDKTAPRFTKKTPTAGPPRRANIYQLAFGIEGEEGQESPDSNLADALDADVFLMEVEDEEGDDNPPCLMF